MTHFLPPTFFKPSQYALILLGLVCILSSQGAFALGGADGGGSGGGFVCRDSSAQVTSVLLDLFEADTYGEKLKPPSESAVPDQVEEAIKEISKIDSAFGALVEKEWHRISDPDLEHSKNFVRVKPGVDIPAPTDVGAHPDKHGCPFVGIMYYNDARKKLIYDAQILYAPVVSNTVRAAALVHESVYAAIRHNFKGNPIAQSSDFSRLLTGCAFSLDPASCLNLTPIRLPDGQLNPDVFPKGKKVWRCSNKSNSFYVYTAKVLRKPIADIGDFQYTLVITKSGGATFGYATTATAKSDSADINVLNSYAGTAIVLDKSLALSITGLESLPVKITVDGNFIATTDDGETDFSKFDLCKPVR